MNRRVYFLESGKVQGLSKKYTGEFKDFSVGK